MQVSLEKSLFSIDLTVVKNIIAFTCISATQCKLLLEVRDFGLPEGLGGFVPALPEGKPISWRLRGFEPFAKDNFFDEQALPSYEKTTD